MNIYSFRFIDYLIYNFLEFLKILIETDVKKGITVFFRFSDQILINKHNYTLSNSENEILTR